MPRKSHTIISHIVMPMYDTMDVSHIPYNMPSLSSLGHTQLEEDFSLLRLQLLPCLQRKIVLSDFSFFAV